METPILAISYHLHKTTSTIPIISNLCSPQRSGHSGRWRGTMASPADRSTPPPERMARRILYAVSHFLNSVWSLTWFSNATFVLFKGFQFDLSRLFRRTQLVLNEILGFIPPEDLLSNVFSSHKKNMLLIYSEYRWSKIWVKMIQFVMFPSCVVHFCRAQIHLLGGIPDNSNEQMLKSIVVFDLVSVCQ